MECCSFQSLPFLVSESLTRKGRSCHYLLQVSERERAALLAWRDAAVMRERRKKERRQKQLEQLIQEVALRLARPRPLPGYPRQPPVVSSNLQRSPKNQQKPGTPVEKYRPLLEEPLKYRPPLEEPLKYRPPLEEPLNSVPPESPPLSVEILKYRPLAVPLKYAPPAGVLQRSRPPAEVLQRSRPPAEGPQISRPPAEVPQRSRPPAEVPQRSRPPAEVLQRSRPPEEVYDKVTAIVRGFLTRRLLQCSKICGLISTIKVSQPLSLSLLSLSV